MTTLPPELEGFAEFLDAQPSNVQSIFHYCLCLMMVEAGKMVLVETLPGEDGAVYVFRSSVGEEFSVTRPDISDEGEKLLVDSLKQILRDKGMLDNE